MLETTRQYLLYFIYGHKITSEASEVMPKSINQETIQKNLSNWIAITSLCLELRKAVIGKRHQQFTDNELTSLVFHEVRLNKEKKWERLKFSPNTLRE